MCCTRDDWASQSHWGKVFDKDAFSRHYYSISSLTNYENSYHRTTKYMVDPFPTALRGGLCRRYLSLSHSYEDMSAKMGHGATKPMRLTTPNLAPFRIENTIIEDVSKFMFRMQYSLKPTKSPHRCKIFGELCKCQIDVSVLSLFTTSKNSLPQF